MVRKRIFELLELFHNRQLSNEEANELLQWINSKKGEKELDEYLADQFDFYVNENEFSVPRQIILDQVKKKAKIQKTFSWTNSCHQYIKYAAVFVFAFLGGMLVFYSSHKGSLIKEGNFLFTVSKANKSTLILEDGTEVWLNSNSKIQYSNNRKITLEGEAFLQVAKDPNNNFTITTSFADVIVYGTTFNVMAYPNDSILKVSLVEGSVGIQVKDRELTYLKTGQEATFNLHTKEMNIREVNMDNVALWHNSELNIVNSNTNILFNKLEGWFGVKFKIINKQEEKHLYNISLRNETLIETLELLNKITPIKYTIKEKEVIVRYVY